MCLATLPHDYKQSPCLINLTENFLSHHGLLAVLTLSQTIPGFYLSAVQVKSFENTVGKEEIAHNEQFLLFPVFSTHLETFLSFLSKLKLSSANSFSLK